MRLTRSALRSLLLAATLAASAAPVHAQTQASYGQYLVVLDDSGSMDDTDPRRLVVLASLALAAGLEDGDQVMLAGLNELAAGEAAAPAFRSPRELLAGRDGEEGPRPASGERVARLGRREGRTPCRGALERARTILNAVADAGAPQTLLLLTDGACTGGSVGSAERWLQGLRSHREERFRFVPLIRQGGGRLDRGLGQLAERTGWVGETQVAFDARALLRAFAGVLSFSRGLRYDDGGRVGLERTFAGARAVRALAIAPGGAERIALQRVERGGEATAVAGGATFQGEQGWSFRVASLGPRETPYAVRTGTPGAEVLVIPVYGRLRVEAVVAPCGDAPPLPWTVERAVRAGQPACAWARLVGDAGESLVPGESFDFGLELCATSGCEAPSAMQPGEEGRFHAVLGDVPLGRHERTFRATGGALAFPVVTRRGFAAMSFGVHQVARAEAPETPIAEIDLGALPKPTPEQLSLVYTGSFPAGAQAAVRCELEGPAAGCVRCVPASERLALQDRMNVQLTVEATPFCAAASEDGALPFSAQLVLAPEGAAAEALPAHALPLRGELRHAAVEPLELSLLGGSVGDELGRVPAPASPTAVEAEIELDDDDLTLSVSVPERVRAEEDGRAPLSFHVEAGECCAPGTHEGVLHLRSGESVLDVPVRVEVRDPGFWVCPGQRILRWAAAVLGVLLLIWIVRGFLGPAKLRDGALLLYARSHERLLELRDGDDGWRQLKRFVETKRGFRRNAALHLGGRRAPLPSLKRMPDDGRIEARKGDGATLIVSGPGVERFTESKGWHELEPGEYPVSNRIVLKRGEELFLEFRR
ncbi:MAG: hypothetical protein CMH59_20430 [Myxococcales bacterium]|nr:hypothetical protein [Myxococcales bacterium]